MCTFVGGGARGWAVVVRATAAGGGGGFSRFSSKLASGRLSLNMLFKL